MYMTLNTFETYTEYPFTTPPDNLLSRSCMCTPYSTVLQGSLDKQVHHISGSVWQLLIESMGLATDTSLSP